MIACLSSDSRVALQAARRGKEQNKMFAFEVVFRSVFTQEKKFSEKNEKV